MNVTKMHNYVKVLSTTAEYMFTLYISTSPCHSIKFKLLSILYKLFFDLFYYLFRSIKGEKGKGSFCSTPYCQLL